MRAKIHTERKKNNIPLPRFRCSAFHTNSLILRQDEVPHWLFQYGRQADERCGKSAVLYHPDWLPRPL